MNMKAQLYRGIAAGVLLLGIGMNTQAQCPNTAMAVTQVVAGCGADVSFSVTNDIGFQSVQWSLNGNFISDQSSQDIYLEAGVHQISLVSLDNNLCVYQASEEITVSSPLIVELPDDNNYIACSGVLNISPVVTGGSGDLSYVWEPANAFSDPTSGNPDITASSYTEIQVSVMDNQTGCVATDWAYFQPASSTPGVQYLNLCNTNGWVNFGMNWGHLTYTWSAVDPVGIEIDMSSVTSNVYQASQPGTYTLIADRPGCNSVSWVYEVSECASECPHQITYGIDPNACGTVYCFDAGSGFAGYLWQINGMVMSEEQVFCTPDWLWPGEHTVSISTWDDDDCGFYSDINIEIPEPEFTVSISSSDGFIACNGTLFTSPTVTGGSGDFSYQWTPAFAVNDPTAQGVQIQQSFPLWVSVAVTDNETGCTASDSVFVSPNIQVNQTVSLCNGSAELTLDPGSMVYSWTATDPDGNSIDMSGVTGNSFSATQAGTYTVMTYYSACNQVFHEFVVVNIVNVSLLRDTVYTCTQGFCDASATAIVSGGVSPYTHQWADPSAQTTVTAIGLCPSGFPYPVIVTDANGCTGQAEVLVLDGPPPTPIPEIAESIIYENCEAFLCLIASDGYEAYEWFINATSVGVGQQWCNDGGMDLTESSIAVVATDAYGCVQASSSLEVEALVEPTLNAMLFNDSIACNGTLFIGPTVSGGSGDYSYQWTPSFAVNDPTAQGVQIQQSFPLWVSVTVTDNETGCTASDSVFISPNIQQNQTVSLCNGPAELTLDPGSMVYNWTATDPLGNTIDMSGVTGNSFSATQQGTYTVMTYYSACNQVFHEFVVTGSTLQVGLGGIGNPPYACFGDCYYVSAFGSGGTPPYTVEWSDGSTSSTLEACTGGDYTATITDAAGCASTASINIPGCPDECNSWFTYTQECGLNCFTAFGTTPIVGYSWDFGDGSHANVTEQSICHVYAMSGTFDVVLEAIDADGCVSTFSAPVTYSEEFVGSLVVVLNDTIACNGTLAGIGPQVSGGSGDYLFQWEPAAIVSDPTAQSPLITASFPQWITVTVTDNETGCTASDSLMYYPNIPSTSVVALCNPTTLLAPDPGSESYSWSGVSFAGIPMVMEIYSSSFQPLWPGTYTVETAYPGCNTVTHTFDVTGCDAPCPHNTDYSLVVENCTATVCIDLGPGFSSYSYIDNTGSSASVQSFCRTYSFPGHYYITSYTVDALDCEFLSTIHVPVDDCTDSVWPGDVNFDGIADNDDLLWLGLAYDQTGPVRPDASLVWEAQPAPDWNFNFSQNNVNLKHADTDGNGTVNFADTVAISLNYGQTHGKTENALAGNIPAVWVQAVPDTVAPGNGIVATVHLGSAAQPVDSLHGIAFTLTFNDLLVDDADFTIDFSTNVLGTVGSDVMTLRKLFLPDGEVDVAVTRNTLQNFGGYGPLATFHIVTTDNLSGIHELRIGVSGVTAITAHGHAVELATVADTVIIDSDHVGIGEAFGAHLSIHPNPTKGFVRVDGLLGDVTAEVLDAMGRVISRSGNSGSASLTLDLSGQPAGFYLLRLSGAEGVAVRRVLKHN